SPFWMAVSSPCVMTPVFASMAAWAFEPAMSCSARRLSTSMEAFIASMTWSGWAENRPPHIELLSGFFVMSLRPAFSAALLALFPAAGQPGGTPKAEAPAAPATPVETAAAPEAPAPEAPSQLDKFKTGQFESLDTAMDL